MERTLDELLALARPILNRMDGDAVAVFFNELLGGVTYLGDSVYQTTCDTKPELYPFICDLVYEDILGSVADPADPTQEEVTKYIDGLRESVDLG